MSQPTHEQLQATLAELATRVESLEAELATLRAELPRVEALAEELAAVRAALPRPEVPEEVVIAISAAVAAFLGHRARLTQVRYSTSHTWAQQGRAQVQRRNVILGVR